MGLSEADTRAKLIDPAIHARGWTEDLIRREETAGAIEGRPTERIWYYDLSDLKVGKKTPFTLERMGDFFELVGDSRAGGTVGRPDSERSWTVIREAIEAGNYDLKAVNPHRVVEEDKRTPEELLDEIERQQKVIAEAIAELRRL